MRVSAKTDYAVRALLELAVAGDGPVKGERLAQAQSIPLKFLENILTDLRHAGIVRAQRGAEGGYWLARSPADVRARGGDPGGGRPARERTRRGARGRRLPRAAENLQTVWIAVRASMRAVVDETTLDDVVSGRLPDAVRRLTEAPDAWSRR